MNFCPLTASWIFLSLSYFSRWPSVFPRSLPFSFLKKFSSCSRVASLFLFCHFLSFLSSLTASFTSNYPVCVKGRAFPSVSLTRATHTHTRTHLHTHTHTQTFCGLAAPPVLPVLLSVLVQLHCANTEASSSVTRSTFTRGNRT